MTSNILSDLQRRLSAEGLLDEPTIDDGFVSGRAQARWRAVLDRIAEEIEDAVGDPDAIAEKVDLRLDLEVHSISVLPDSALLSFAAPRQFPESWIRAQLDDELEIEDVFVDEKLEGTAS